MKDKHTPGPWIYDMGFVVAQEPVGDVYLATAEESAANGVLMAAAPELLQAARWAVEDWDENVAKGRDRISVEMIEHLRAAIALAVVVKST
jgi:hypothetical protein